MTDLTSRRGRYAAAGGLAVLITAVLLAARVLADLLAAGLMTDAYQAWCEAGGTAGNEYGLNCVRQTGIYEAATRTHPGDLVLLVLLVISGVAILRGRPPVRAAGCLVPAVTPLWGYLTLAYVNDLPERLATAAVLGFPDLVPGWYAAIGVGVAIALLAVPTSGVLIQIAGAIRGIWRPPRRAGMRTAPTTGSSTLNECVPADPPSMRPPSSSTEPGTTASSTPTASASTSPNKAVGR